MEALSTRVQVEQQNFLEEQWKRGTSDRQRYSFVTQQAERQMQVRRLASWCHIPASMKSVSLRSGR